MLYLFLEDDKPDDMIEDVELGFNMFKLDCSDEEELIVNKIEQGRIIRDDYTAFIDRFGYKLPIDFLSTGCKTALCVLHNPDRCVSLLEGGSNVHVIVLTKLRSGIIWIPDYGSGFFNGKGDNEIDVCLDSYRFTSLNRLNYYLNEERGWGVNLKRSGVTCIN